LVDELASKTDHGYHVDDTLRRRAGRTGDGEARQRDSVVAEHSIAWS
jgi:hypothetical protein